MGTRFFLRVVVIIVPYTGIGNGYFCGLSGHRVRQVTND